MKRTNRSADIVEKKKRMATETDIPAEPFFVLLTDALRAGPGSPEWRQAVATLRQEGFEGSDHALLIAVRQQLESGKDYRSIRAGQGFTRRLMERLDEEKLAPPRKIPIAGLLAICGLAVMGVIVMMTVINLIHQPLADLGGLTAQLREQPFNRVMASASFDGALPAGWTMTGPLKLDTQAGLRVAQAPFTPDFQPGAIVTAATTPVDESAAIEALVRSVPLPGTIVQLYVADVPQNPGERPNELAWVLQNGKAGVVRPNGQFAAAPVPFKTDPDGALVRLAVGPEAVVVSAGDHELFAGLHGLSIHRPRVFGIRFLSKGGKASPEPVVMSVRVIKP